MLVARSGELATFFLKLRVWFLSKLSLSGRLRPPRGLCPRVACRKLPAELRVFEPSGVFSERDGPFKRSLPHDFRSFFAAGILFCALFLTASDQALKAAGSCIVSNVACAQAHLLGSFRQHVQQHSPLGLGDQVGQASPDIFCGRSPRVSLPSQSQETLLDPARRPGAFIKSAFRPGDLSLPRAGQLRIPQRASPPREVSPSSSDLKHSSSELEADSGAVSQDEDQASPWAMPASTKQGATCAQLSTPLAEAACSPRLRRRQPAEWRTSPSTPEAPGTHRFGASTPTRKRRYSSQQPTSEGQQEAGSADGLRPRALFSAESGELGPTQARATKSASISRESLPASGPSRMRPGRMNQVIVCREFLCSYPLLSHCALL